MDAYCYALSVIKKLGYICDTLSYLIDYQQGLFSRRFFFNINVLVFTIFSDEG